MYQKIVENFQENIKQSFNAKTYQTALQQTSDLIEINKSTAEELIRLQSNLFTELAGEAFNQAKSLISETDVSIAAESQKVYIQTLQSRLISAAEASQETLAKNRDKVADVVKNATEYAKSN